MPGDVCTAVYINKKTSWFPVEMYKTNSSTTILFSLKFHEQLVLVTSAQFTDLDDTYNRTPYLLLLYTYEATFYALRWMTLLFDYWGVIDNSSSTFYSICQQLYTVEKFKLIIHLFFGWIFIHLIKNSFFP